LANFSFDLLHCGRRIGIEEKRDDWTGAVLNVDYQVSAADIEAFGAVDEFYLYGPGSGSSGEALLRLGILRAREEASVNWTVRLHREAFVGERLRSGSVARPDRCLD